MSELLGSINAMYIAIGAAAVALVFSMILTGKIKASPAGDDRMQKLAKAVQDGAMAFLKTEYSILAVFAVIVTVVLWVGVGAGTAVSFVLGAASSGIAGWVGMRVATQAAVRR